MGFTLTVQLVLRLQVGRSIVRNKEHLSKLVLRSGILLRERLGFVIVTVERLCLSFPWGCMLVKIAQ